MLKQENENRSQMEFFCVDEFVPQDHLLRKIDKVVDFSRIYDPLLYCRIYGIMDTVRENGGDTMKQRRKKQSIQNIQIVNDE